MEKTYWIAAGLDEYDIWRADFRPHLQDLPKNVLEIWEFCLTEMVNNAIEHSAGRKIDIELIREGGASQVFVSDDGIGIFRKIRSSLQLVDERQALLELSKGKITTDPDRHSGQGIFFTSRVLDSFGILSGGLIFSHDSSSPEDFLQESSDSQSGTFVRMKLADDSTRKEEDVFRAFSSPDGVDFTKTIVPVKLANFGEGNLVSRSQAKLLMSRVDRFQTIVLDFDGVDKIGQAFADQIFRVYVKDHPGVLIIPIHANENVTRMIVHTAQSARPHNGG